MVSLLSSEQRSAAVLSANAAGREKYRLVALHGFGANGLDLVPVGEALRAQLPQLSFTFVQVLSVCKLVMSSLVGTGLAPIAIATVWCWPVLMDD